MTIEEATINPELRLGEMSRSCKVEGCERAVYLDPANIEEVKILGKKLFEMGGTALMRDVATHLSSPQFKGDGMELGLAWNNIGDWRA
jgi:hypothetical protein